MGKAKIQTPKSMEDAFAKLFYESRKKSKTFGESRKAREKKQAKSLLDKQIASPMGRVRILIGADRERALLRTLRRTSLRAIVETIKCPCCQSEREEIRSMEVWSKGQDSTGADVWRLTHQVKSNGDYDFHNGLKIEITETVGYRICPSCLRADSTMRNAGKALPKPERKLWKPEYLIERLEAEAQRLETDKADLQRELAQARTEIKRLLKEAEL